MTSGEGTSNVVITVREPPPMSFQCPVLTPSNYTSWAIKVESIMDAQGIWIAIDPPRNVNVDPRIVKRARAFLLQALPEDILLQVAVHRDAKGIWDALKTRHLGADRVQKARLQSLNREFELLRMSDSDSIDSMAAKIMELVSKARSLGSTIPEVKQVQKLLNSVPEKFLPTKNAFGQLMMTRTEWQERQRTESSSFRRGRSAADRSRGRGASRSSSRGRGTYSVSRKDEKDEKPRPSNGRRDRKILRCFNCDKLGHFSAECKAPRRREEDLHLTKEDEEPTSWCYPQMKKSRRMKILTPQHYRKRKC